ncbi:cell wall metabolism sensor histidine kinase WalK [Amnibacterium sp.]|uniref:sensor histidine kinase n=1 Tax=Amnibacterium sp. TaxID=1872496 RepID=UPI0026381350|nr:HAMP domain-containing sensor histidine kinase [Amnibacterium sp.]MCU1472150.1 histidine kinase [Amnibacterium sp.]
MSTAQAVVLALVFGLAVGAVFAVLLRSAMDRGAAALELVDRRLPDGIAAALGALDGPALMVDGSNTVLLATAAAESLGLVDGRLLNHRELVVLVDESRARHTPRTKDLLLRRGTVGPPTLHIAARAAPIGLSAVLLLVEDRSDAVRLEAVRRDFVGNVSHELKTPIGAVGLLAEALDSAADDPDQVRRFASRLTSEAARLAQITREIIDFSRIQSRDPLHEPQPVALDDIVHAAVDRNHVLADAKRIDVVVGKRSGLFVLGDETLLTTAVHNLVANAVQYSPPNGHVGIGARSRDGVVEIAVTDQGVGIPDEEIDRVFERFYRGDPARSRQTGGTGTGLGLSIVKHIAENHGGEVRVWSRPGRGSTFTIRLPETPAPPIERPRRRDKERV